MSETVYWRGKEESVLAGFQQDQGNTNHCAKYAAATAVNLLTGLDLAGENLISWLEKRFLKGTPAYTIFGNNNGSLVFQTANQVRWLAAVHNIGLEIRCKRGNSEILKESLKDGGAVNLVSITYFQGEEPRIARGRATNSSLARARWVGGHIMIGAAHDPCHQNYAGEPTPWGFISSWGSQAELYWMGDVDFQRTWGRLSALNMITVRIR